MTRFALRQSTDAADMFGRRGSSSNRGDVTLCSWWGHVTYSRSQSSRSRSTPSSTERDQCLAAIWNEKEVTQIHEWKYLCDTEFIKYTDACGRPACFYRLAGGYRFAGVLLCNIQDKLLPVLFEWIISLGGHGEWDQPLSRHWSLRPPCTASGSSWDRAPSAYRCRLQVKSRPPLRCIVSS